MGLEQQIRDALETAFAPVELVVENESHRHAGHAGDDGSGESHWRVTISAPALSTMSRIDRHRAVHAALGPAIMGRLHALALTVRG
jgi:BolA protein